MTTLTQFYQKFRLRNLKFYLSFLCLITLLNFSSCNDANDNWEDVDSQKVLLAASTNSTKENKFEKVLQKFLTISSDNQLKKYIHPQLGFYINHKPGAISIVEHFDNLDQVYQHLPHLEPYFKKFNGKNPKNEKTPAFDCESFSKEGTFYQKTSSFKEIEKGIEIKEKITEKKHSKEEKEFAKKIDKKINHVVVLTDDYLEIGFTNINGKWYMLWFNLAKFDCSA